MHTESDQVRTSILTPDSHRPGPPRDEAVTPALRRSGQEAAPGPKTSCP